MSAQKFFRFPWAVSGDKAAIAEAIQPDGTVSYTEGFGPDYSRNPATDAAAKRVPRAKTNQLYADLTENIRQYQIYGTPEYVLAAQNGGVAIAYATGARARYDAGDGAGFVVWESLVDGNSVLPGSDPAKWARVAPFTGSAGLTASATEVAQGLDVPRFVAPEELVAAAREGRWTYAGVITYSTATALVAVYPGAMPFTETAGAAVTFRVPSQSPAGPLTLKVGAGVAHVLKTSAGLDMVAGDLQPNRIYDAVFDGTNWQLRTSVTSQLNAGGTSAGILYGLTIANAAANPTRDITVAIGSCRNSNNSRNIELVAPITKRLDQPWAAGTGNGGRDTGTLANDQSWHVFVILNPDTLAVDALFSQSPTNPTLPSGFTFFRRLGGIVLDKSATTIKIFRQTGDWFKNKQQVADFNSAQNGSVGFLRRIAVPEGIKVEAELYYCSTSEPTYGTPTAPGYSGIYDPDFGTPTGIGGWGQVRFYTTSTTGGRFMCVVARQFTDTSRAVYTTSNDASDSIQIGVLGWRDERSRFG